MRLLLDESVPRRFRLSLPAHEIHTAVDMGWSGVANGKLPALAAGQFDALITVDKNLPYQQNLSTLPLSVILQFFHLERSGSFQLLKSIKPDSSASATRHARPMSREIEMASAMPSTPPAAQR